MRLPEAERGFTDARFEFLEERFITRQILGWRFEV
jgi:hypothetical protein